MLSSEYGWLSRASAGRTKYICKYHNLFQCAGYLTAVGQERTGLHREVCGPGSVHYGEQDCIHTCIMHAHGYGCLWRPDFIP